MKFSKTELNYVDWFSCWVRKSQIFYANWWQKCELKVLGKNVDKSLLSCNNVICELCVLLIVRRVDDDHLLKNTTYHCCCIILFKSLTQSFNSNWYIMYYEHVKIVTFCFHEYGTCLEQKAKKKPTSSYGCSFIFHNIFTTFCLLIKVLLKENIYHHVSYKL